MSQCRSGCATPGAHRSWGECVRAARIQTGADIGWRDRQKAWDRELDLYESAARQGVQPRSTRTPDIRAALDAADRLGVAA